jgi:hypothetical protein
MAYRRHVVSSVLTLAVCALSVHCGDDGGDVAPYPTETGGSAGKAGGAAGATAGGKGGAAGAAAGAGGATAGAGGAAAGAGGATAGAGGATAGAGGATAGAGGAAAGAGGATAGFGGQSQAGAGGVDQGGAAGSTQGGTGGTDPGGAGGTDPGGAGGTGGTEQGGAGQGGDAGAGGAVVAEDFSLAVDPATVKIAQGAGASVNVTATKVGGFDASMTLEVLGLPAGVTAANVTLDPGATTVGMTLLASSGAALGAVGGVTIRGTSGGLVHSVPLGLEITAPAAKITAVELLAATGDTVLAYKTFRQGFEGVRIKVSGTDLGALALTDVKLGTIVAKAISNGTGFFVATFDIPHGEAIGDKDLSITNAAGTTSSPAAVSVTAIVSRPTGNDTTGRGTSDAPFKTLTKANAVSGTNDTILLGGGQFAGADETFPIVLAKGVTLRGAATLKAQTSVIQHTAGGSCLEVPDSAQLDRLSLTTCAIKKAGAGKLTIADVKSDGAGVGVNVTAGEAVFSCSANVAGCAISGNKTGIVVAAGASVSGDPRVTGSAAMCLSLAGSATLTNATFTTCGPIAGTGAGGSVVVTGAGDLKATALTLADIPRTGISVAGTGSVAIDGGSLAAKTLTTGARAFFNLAGSSTLSVKNVKGAASGAAGNIPLLELDGGAKASFDGCSFVGDSGGQAVVGHSGAKTDVTFSSTALTGFTGGTVVLGATFGGTVLLGKGTTVKSSGTALVAMLQEDRTTATTAITVASGVTFDGILVPPGTKSSATVSPKAGVISVWKITDKATIVFQLARANAPSPSARSTVLRTQNRRPAKLARPPVLFCDEPSALRAVLELLDRLRPIGVEQPRERAIGEELAAGLAARAVVALVLGVDDVLHLRATRRAGLAELAVDGHLGPKGGHLLGEFALRFGS